MHLKQLGSSLLLCTAVSLPAASAWAQDAVPAEAAPPPAEPPPAPPPSAYSAPAAEPAAPAETFPPAWFRIDSDGALLQLWAGATHPLTDTIGLATDIYVNSQTLGEFDLGPTFTAGPFVATPMLGVQFDWAAKKTAALVPQFYLVGGPDPFYVELWVQNYLYTLFDYGGATGPARNTLYFRLFADYKVSKYFAVGPQVEATLSLSGEGDTLTSLPIGGSVALTNYGVGNTLFLFLGVETQDAGKVDDAALAGRLTFVKNF